MTATEQFEFDDLQGIFRFGHGQLPAACFLLLTIRNEDDARAWLQQATITSAQSQQSLPDTALQVAFTARGLGRLGVEDHVVAGFSDAFVSGMVDSNRSRRLGDIGANAPEHWHWGGSPGSTPDLLLMLYARPGKLSSFEAELKNATFSAGFALIDCLTTNGNLDREPFGFADGISQPKIDWQGAQSTDSHDRRAYSNWLAPGELVLGYPNEYGEYTERPLLAPDQQRVRPLPAASEQPALRDLGRNGGYLVFRQLEQDVHGFWKYLDQIADGDAEHRDRLAATLVGRERDGLPLVGSNSNRNAFNFDDDPVGRQCPIGAHIRRANPRTGDLPPGSDSLFRRVKQRFGFDRDSRQQDLVAATRFHRLLRRGRPYGSTLTLEQALQEFHDHETRGIHFISLGANLARQFEFVQSAWLASAKFGGLEQESDPLIGNRQTLRAGAPTDQFTLPQTVGPRCRLQGLPQFVTVRGGGYFFVPGLRALDYLIQR